MAPSLTIPRRFCGPPDSGNGGFTCGRVAASAPQILLGRLAAQIERLPRLGETLVVLGWSLHAEGRRIVCGSAVHDAEGRYVAWGLATWIVLRAAPQ